VDDPDRLLPPFTGPIWLADDITAWYVTTIRRQHKGWAALAFAIGGGLPVMALGFAIGGLAIRLVETAQNSAVAALASAEVRGSAFGLLAGIQGFGNLGASAVAGIIWTAASPSAAFAYLAVWMVVAVAAISAAMRPH